MRGRLIVELSGDPAGFELARIRLAQPKTRDAIGFAAEHVQLELVGCPELLIDDKPPEWKVP